MKRSKRSSLGQQTNGAHPNGLIRTGTFMSSAKCISTFYFTAFGGFTLNSKIEFYVTEGRRARSSPKTYSEEYEHVLSKQYVHHSRRS